MLQLSAAVWFLEEAYLKNGFTNNTRRLNPLVFYILYTFLYLFLIPTSLPISTPLAWFYKAALRIKQL